MLFFSRLSTCVGIYVCTSLDAGADYHFLREIIRERDVAGRDRRVSKRRKIVGRLAKLRRAALSRGVDLRIAPKALQRRQENETYIDRNGKLFWTVDMVFVSALDGRVTVKDKRVREDKKLRTLVQMHVGGPRAWPGKASLQYRLKEYGSVDYVLLLLKHTCHRDGKPVFVRVDPEQSVQSILSNQIVLEYPEFHVVLARDLSSYQIDEDAEEEEEEDNQGGGVTTTAAEVGVKEE